MINGSAVIKFSSPGMCILKVAKQVVNIGMNFIFVDFIHV